MTDQTDPTANTTSSAPEKAMPSGQSVLKDDLEILSQSPLPQYDIPGAKAYKVNDRHRSGVELFALVGNAEITPRLSLISTFEILRSPHLLKIVDHGMVPWKGAHSFRPVIVYECPPGPKLMENLESRVKPVTDVEIVDKLIPAFTTVMRDMSARNITHRAIRPDNIFYSDDNKSSIILGDALGAPPGFGQPVVMEPIESAMTDPIGRGPGFETDDMYAMGVTLVMLFLGRNPFAGKTREQILEEKIELGSFAALTGAQRIPLNLLEVFRGLLSDDPRERWTYRELEKWMAGERVSPKRSKIYTRSSRPFVFEDHEYYNPNMLADAMARNWSESLSVMKTQSFVNWIGNYLPHADKVDQLVAQLKNVSPSATPMDDRLLSRSSMIMDPLAPIRYRDLSFHFEGIGTALSAYFADEKKRRYFVEIIKGRILLEWVAAQDKTYTRHNSLAKEYEGLLRIVETPSPGYGIERCLYHLNPNTPCLSQIVASYFVINLKSLLLALDDVARSADRPSVPMDRHIAAFCASRSRSVNDNVLREIGEKQDPKERSIGTLRILATVQSHEKVGPLPSLASWLAETLAPVMDDFKNIERRNRIRKDIKNATKSGMLNDILLVIDNIKLRRKDEEEFHAAKLAYVAIDREIDRIAQESVQKPERMKILAEQIAASVSGFVASTLVVLILMIHFFF